MAIPERKFPSSGPIMRKAGGLIPNGGDTVWLGYCDRQMLLICTFGRGGWFMGIFRGSSC